MVTKIRKSAKILARKRRGKTSAVDEQKKEKLRIKNETLLKKLHKMGFSGRYIRIRENTLKAQVVLLLKKGIRDTQKLAALSGATENNIRKIRWEYDNNKIDQLDDIMYRILEEQPELSGKQVWIGKAGKSAQQIAKEMIQDGKSTAEIQKATNLTTTRIYQIRRTLKQQA